jgi:hypothetical protein
MINRKIVVERKTSKRLQPSVVLAQVQRCTTISLKGSRGQGWKFTMPSRPLPPTQDNDMWVYRITVHFSTTSDRASLETKWPEIVKRFAEAGTSGNLKGSPWKVVEPEGFESVAADAKVEAVKAVKLKELADAPKKLGELNLVLNGHYDRIYGRKPHINRVVDALRLAKTTDWSKRTHSLLDGPPGCGKTEIMLATSQMIGEEGKSWLWFDATSMTKAGVIELIMENDTVPGVLFIEEIEKCPENDLRWLLGIMDVRGQIRRTNYRVGNQAKNVRMVVIATANDVQLLKTVMAGALYSRFQNKIYCAPPDREIMRQIMLREINEIKGDLKWVEPALEFAVDKWGMDDPRDIITILSCGRDRLMTGAYQKDFEATMHPLERKHLLAKLKKRDASLTPA